LQDQRTGGNSAGSPIKSSQLNSTHYTHHPGSYCTTIGEPTRRICISQVRNLDFFLPKKRIRAGESRLCESRAGGLGCTRAFPVDDPGSRGPVDPPECHNSIQGKALRQFTSRPPVCHSFSWAESPGKTNGGESPRTRRIPLGNPRSPCETNPVRHRMPGAAPPNVVAHAACAREDIPGIGWQRQAESSELTDGFPPDAAGSAKLKACRCHPHNARKLARTPRTWAHDRKVAAERVARSNSFDRGRSGSSGRHAQAALGHATQGPEPALPQSCRAPPPSSGAVLGFPQGRVCRMISRFAAPALFRAAYERHARFRYG
jgi:hypothetical protein